MNLRVLNNFSTRKSKGQFSIEYLVAFVLFASVLLYLSFQIASALPGLRKASRKNIKLSKAHRITEELLETPGHPVYWETGDNAERYGLASEPCRLDEQKVREFNESCTEDYSTLKRKLGLNLSSFEVSLYSVASGDKVLLDCGKEHVPKGVSVSEIQRYAVLENGEMFRMVFKIW